MERWRVSNFSTTENYTCCARTEIYIADRASICRQQNVHIGAKGVPSRVTIRKDKTIRSTINSSLHHQVVSSLSLRCYACGVGSTRTCRRKSSIINISSIRVCPNRIVPLPRPNSHLGHKIESFRKEVSFREGEKGLEVERFFRGDAADDILQGRGSLADDDC